MPSRQDRAFKMNTGCFLVAGVEKIKSRIKIGTRSVARGVKTRIYCKDGLMDAM